MRYFILSLLILAIGCTGKVAEQEAVGTKPDRGVTGDSAMVSTTHPIASEVGKAILKRGGNAVDAAIAIQFALAVVHPVAGNIGGGGFAVIRTADGQINSLDFREKAPQKADKDMYLDEQGNVIPKLSTQGHLAAGVPGSVDGMFRLHEQYGSLPMNELINPAIALAKEGVVLFESDAYNINKYQDLFRQYGDESNYYIKEHAWEAGDTIYHRDLAGTLQLISENGRDGFYKGKIARQISEEMKRGGGFIDEADLAAYSSKWRTPVTGSYRGYKIISMPPPSSGGVAIIQLLKGAEKYNISETGHNTAETIHILTELERRVFADRATHLADPDYYDVPVEMLLSDTYNEERFSTISPDTVTSSEEIKEGKVDIIESMETTHFSVVDEQGNAVSITTTLNGYFGCKVMVKGAGFFLNNEMDDFSAKPGVPNMFGLVGAEANAIAPGKRMLSSMTPTLLEKNGKLAMVVGTPGGSTIITSVFQTIMNVIDHRMTMKEAISAPRQHHQWLPNRVVYEESTLDEETLRKLRELGHEMEERGSYGRMDCILVLPDGTLEGASDPRSYGTAAGY
ncbi:MAG: gamma-glutamyltransferase [Cyclobacteriaceae bacterium]